LATRETKAPLSARGIRTNAGHRLQREGWESGSGKEREREEGWRPEWRKVRGTQGTRGVRLEDRRGQVILHRMELTETLPIAMSRQSPVLVLGTARST